MQKPNQDELKINLNHIVNGLFLEIAPEQASRVRHLTQNIADQFDESEFQLFEGHSYEYEFEGTDKENFRLETRINGIITPSYRYPYRGRIKPNIYVGQLQLQIVNTLTKQDFPLIVEVIATKFNKKEDLSYRENYRKMLEDITDKCTDLIMQINTPISQRVTIDYKSDYKTVYQRFCFVKSFLESVDFEEAILRIISNPSTTWHKVESAIKSSQVKRFNRTLAKQIVNATNRINVTDLDYLNDLGLTSIPRSLQSMTRIESIDTHENRFIKHVLRVFLNFIEDCQAIFHRNDSVQFAYKESCHLIDRLNNYLSYSFFNEISQAKTLKLNSPLLQKRSGYREVLNRWLQFNLASKLIWQGGEDVYEAGKRDISTLYEYWLFFQLHELIVQKFKLQSYQKENFEHLFKLDEKYLSLKLKSGKELIIKGETYFVSRNLMIRFSYNRTFKGGNDYSSGIAGSITTTLRPDYTLSIWPSSFSEVEAEKQDVITHIHFDAKYKIQNIKDQYTESEDEDELNCIEERERKGTFKNIDILKMHAYKDAIRRTGGAYILYPGSVEKRFDGFHEVLPGLGAFTINPSKHDTGINGLSLFLDQVIKHLVDRTTQRERIANMSNQILNEPRLASSRNLKSIPNYLERNKIDLLKTHVIVGYVENQIHLDWCLSNRLYNFRMNDNISSLEFTPEVLQAKYLLICESNKDKASKLFKIVSKGYKVLSKNQLIQLGYESPSEVDYLVVGIEPCEYWHNLEVKYQEFEEYKNLSSSVQSNTPPPFLITLDKLLKI